MQSYLFECKAFVSFILTNLSFYNALPVTKNPYSEGIFNAAATGTTLHFKNGVRRNLYN